MKNKLLTGIATAILIMPIGAFAEILSSYEDDKNYIIDQCNTLWDGEYDIGFDACMSCFFLKYGTVDTKEFRRKGEIKFNTATKQCSDPAPKEYEYYDTIDECYVLPSDPMDECLACLTGRYGEITAIDDGEYEYRGMVYTIGINADYGYCSIENDSLFGCKSGWYGRPEDIDSHYFEGCEKCPGDGAESNNGIGKTTDITDCYMPGNKQLKDSTGTYKYINDCYYTN